MIRPSLLQVAIHGALLELKEGAGGGGSQPNPDLKAIQEQVTKTHADLQAFIAKANQEIAASGKASTDTTTALTKLTEELNKALGRLDKIEAKGNRLGEGGDLPDSVGLAFTKDAAYTSLTKQRRGAAAKQFPGFDMKAIINAQGQNQPLVPDMRVPGVVQAPNRRLRIRDLIPGGRTSSNLVQYVRENVFTNNAGPQAGGSPTVGGENQLKNESNITFDLQNSPVVTIAHFILASTQVLDDAPMLESYINSRLLYGLALEEEEEILLGDGQAGSLTGLMFQATAYNRAADGTKIDVIRRAITQLQLSEFDAEFIVLNPQDWESIELTKDTQGRYILADPMSMAQPRLWGLPVISTNTMPVGQFLVANGSMAAQIWDRQEANVQLSTEDSDNFRRNMVTIRAEERIALTVYRPAALIKGAFTV